jgi:hypothetical protein
MKSMAENIGHSHIRTRVVQDPGKIFDKDVARKASPSRSTATMVDDFGHLFLPLIGHVDLNRGSPLAFEYD